MLIAPDTLVSIEFTGTDLRLKGYLLGQRHKQYLIIGLPNASSLKGMLLPESLVTIRYIAEGVAYGFKSEILNSVSRPESVVFVAHPEKIETLQIRKSQRISCNFPAETTIGDKNTDCMIVDLSSGGCRLIFHEERHDLLKKNLKGDEELLVKFYALEEKNSYQISGKVTSIAANGKKFTLGLKFTEKDNSSEQIIQSYIEKLSKFLDSEDS